MLLSVRFLGLLLLQLHSTALASINEDEQTCQLPSALGLVQLCRNAQFITVSQRLGWSLLPPAVTL